MTGPTKGWRFGDEGRHRAHFRWVVLLPRAQAVETILLSMAFCVTVSQAIVHSSLMIRRAKNNQVAKPRFGIVPMAFLPDDRNSHHFLKGYGLVNLD